MTRVILLGASNLTYGFPLIVESLKASYTSPVELFAAHGHGRSYGNWSRVLGRRLPGIRGCSLWDAVPNRPSADDRTLGLITDVGNDLLYGADPEAILSWVEECAERLSAMNAAIVFTGIPVTTIKRMSAPRYHATRLCFFPARGPRWPDMKRMVDDLDAGMRGLATKFDGTCIEPEREWYALDPIHIRRSQRVAAWREILSAWPIDKLTMSRPSLGRAAALWRLKPALRIMHGREQRTPQPVLRDDTLSVSLF